MCLRIFSNLKRMRDFTNGNLSSCLAWVCEQPHGRKCFPAEVSLLWAWKPAENFPQPPDVMPLSSSMLKSFSLFTWWSSGIRAYVGLVFISRKHTSYLDLNWQGVSTCFSRNLSSCASCWWTGPILFRCSIPSHKKAESSETQVNLMHIFNKCGLN